MTDPRARPNPLFLREAELREAMELLFYAYREFVAEPDRRLEQAGFGRAHHRAVYFIGRYPGISVTDLLGILRITKQSLSRVLGELVATGHVRQQADPGDRRRRLLCLTATGHELEQALSAIQMRCLARAFRATGPEAVAGFRLVMREITHARDRDRLDAGDRPAARNGIAPDGDG